MPHSAAGLDSVEARRCIRLLEAIVEDRGLLAKLDEKDRVALVMAAGRLSRPHRTEQRKLVRAFRAVDRFARKELDRSARAETHIRAARRERVYVAPSPVPPEERKSRGRLKTPRFCYVCKAGYRDVHFFYDSMCPACGDFNYAKRFPAVGLSGKTALITGARLKIGYQAALMMLRAGATVVATTRFPHDAAKRYAGEADFAAWKDRLRVHGLDLRHSPSVEIFCRYLERTLGSLDILVNNAAQTVRRPPAFYAHLLAGERLAHGDLEPDCRSLLESHETLKGMLAVSLSPKGERAGGREISRGGAAAGSEAVDATGMAVWHRAGPGVGLRESATLSQLKYTYDDAELGLDVFPEGRTDADLQQVDLRKMNSWRMTLADVPTAEMLELFLINAVAPFILSAKLKHLMLRKRTFDKHIVNVSAMEGSFSRGTKTDKHPHTNMAKAALNMLTLTSAPDYAKDGVFMNAVDTGWVTDEDPAHLSARKQKDHDFEPPLDIVDGAARVCDPFFSGLASGEHVCGKFFKDYKPVPW